MVQPFATVPFAVPDDELADLAERRGIHRIAVVTRPFPRYADPATEALFVVDPDPAQPWSLLHHIKIDLELGQVLGREIVSVTTTTLLSDRYEGNAILMCAVPVYDR